MKAVSLIEPGKIRIIETPEPKVGPEDVLIEVEYVGLCGSDLNAYRGLMPMVTFPRIPGHELSGTIVGKGEGVPSHLSEGDRVAVEPYTNCGGCPACLIGRVNCCQFNQTMGVQRDGALLERIAVPFRKIHKSRTLNYVELALVEPLSVGYHAANRGRVAEIDNVLVLGCGAIGIGALAAAARKGANVIALDIDDRKLAEAGRFGARHVINTKTDDVQGRIDKITDGRGVDCAIEAVGLPATYRLAVELAAFAGRIVYIGYAKEDVAFATKLFVARELDIMGSRNALHVFPSVIKMLEERAMPFETLATKTYPLDAAPQAFADWDKNPAAISRILIKTA